MYTIAIDETQAAHIMGLLATQCKSAQKEGDADAYELGASIARQIRDQKTANADLSPVLALTNGTALVQDASGATVVFAVTEVKQAALAALVMSTSGSEYRPVLTEASPGTTLWSDAIELQCVIYDQAVHMQAAAHLL